MATEDKVERTLAEEAWQFRTLLDYTLGKIEEEGTDHYVLLAYYDAKALLKILEKEKEARGL